MTFHEWLKIEAFKLGCFFIVVCVVATPFVAGWIIEYVGHKARKIARKIKR